MNDPLNANDEKRRGAGAGVVDRRVLIALAVLCVLSLLAHLALFPLLPESVPVHWDAAGDVDGWSSRLAALGLDLLPLGLLALCAILPAIDPRREAYRRMGRFYTGFLIAVTLFAIAVTWTTELTVFGIISPTESPIGVLVPTAAGIGLIAVGNYLPKIKRNYTFGCKTPWALDDDVNWRLTHRFAGTAMVVAGVATTISGLFSRQLGEASSLILVGAVLGASVLSYAYSYLVYRNGNRPLHIR